MASRMLLFPLPFRPVMALKSGSKPTISVRWAYDLKPSRTICLMYISLSALIRVPAGFWSRDIDACAKPIGIRNYTENYDTFPRSVWYHRDAPRQPVTT